MRINFTLTELDQFDLTYLSLGAGVQSSALFYMACIGDPIMPKIDFAVFSDTGDEPQYTYDQLGYLTDLSKQYNIPLHIISKDGQPMSAPIFDPKHKFSSIPCFTIDDDGKRGMLKRQCTNEYKIEPIKRHVRKEMGYEKGQRVKKKVLCLQGISLDEITRMKESRDKWQHNGFPLITARMNRNDCAIWTKANGFREVEKSACVYCPFHGNHEWRLVKENKKDWELAVAVDEAIRYSTKEGKNRPVYLHQDCKPLTEIDFQEDMPDLFDNECDGICGI